MGKTRPPYPEDFREQLVALHRSGRTVSSLSAEYGPHVSTIRDWIAKARSSAEGVAVFDDDERAELKRLRKENAQLKLEREILEKAAAWFAQKTVPKSHSGS